MLSSSEKVSALGRNHSKEMRTEGRRKTREKVDREQRDEEKGKGDWRRRNNLLKVTLTID